MTLVKSDIPELLTAGLKTAFFQTFGETPAQWDKIATVVPSERDTEQYAWLGALPGMREFLDERSPADMKPYSYAIQNKTWESTLSIDRTALEDDQYGQIALRVRQMAMVAKQHLDSIVFGLLGLGFASNGYDDVPFFGTHVQGAAQTNKGTDALAALSLQAAITAMMRFTDDKGRPMGTRPNLLVIPPELYWEATQLLNSSFFPDPAAIGSQDLAMNPLKGMLTLLTTPYLASSTNWFLLDTGRVVRGLVLQMRKEFEFQALEGSSENGFLRDQFLYGVRARYNAGFGDWRAAFGAQVA
ncbi:MAG: Mu-like prophage major head subunit gpT family protein [Janthinobacterium lividum]